MTEQRIPHKEEERRECTCYDGWHFLGYLVESDQDLSGEVEVYERVPCRRCQKAAS